MLLPMWSLPLSPQIALYRNLDECFPDFKNGDFPLEKEKSPVTPQKATFEITSVCRNTLAVNKMASSSYANARKLRCESFLEPNYNEDMTR